MKKGIISIIIIFFAGWQTYSQCDPRLSVKPPENPNHFIKSFEAFMPKENDTVLRYTLLLHEGTDYQIKVYESPEYQGKASLALYEGEKLLAINYNKQSGKFYPSFKFKSKKSITYEIVVRKLVKEKYCASWVIEEMTKPGKDNETIETGNQEEPVFVIVEDMPEFKAGQGVESFREWIQANLKYPEEAMKKGIQGKVYVNFIVDKDGSVSDVKIARGVDPILDKAARDLIRSSPKWEKVGKQRGQPVRVAYTFPITYALKHK